MEIKRYSDIYTSDLLEIYSYYVDHSAFTFDIEPPSLEDFHAKLEASHVCLVGIAGDNVIGFVYASAHRAKAAYDTVCETTIYMDADHHGAGYGSRLYAVLLRLLEKLGYYTALGGITVPNAASESLHKKLGFKKAMRYDNIGFKAGEWRNVDWWRKDLLSFESPPESPLSIDDLSDAEWSQILS